MDVEDHYRGLSLLSPLPGNRQSRLEKSLALEQTHKFMNDDNSRAVDDSVTNHGGKHINQINKKTLHTSIRLVNKHPGLSSCNFCYTCMHLK